MTELARKLRTGDYFTLGFGTMVGVGWLVVMDDWLGRGGPLGAVLGFGLGGLALLPIGYVYGRLAERMPDAGSEIAYADAAFGARAGFAAGWVVSLDAAGWALGRSPGFATGAIGGVTACLASWANAGAVMARARAATVMMRFMAGSLLLAWPLDRGVASIWPEHCGVALLAS